jgi:flagellar hook-basal body complex protein FliE
MKVEGIGNKALSEFETGKGKKVEKGFKEIFEEFLSEVNSNLLEASEAEKLFAQGKISNIEEVIYKVEKAEVSLRLLVELRNKVIESYQEIMRMQV